MFYRIATVLGLVGGLLICPPAQPGPAMAAEDPASAWMEEYIGAQAPTFDDADAVVAAFKAALAAEDPAGLARLLGLDPENMLASETYNENFIEVRDLASELLVVKPLAEDRRILLLGREVMAVSVSDRRNRWQVGLRHRGRAGGSGQSPHRRERTDGHRDGAWLRRRAGRLYKETTGTATAFSNMPRCSSARRGTYDGLYWPPGEGVPESPAGAFASDEEIAEGEPGQGYFGYRYRILKGQGDNVVGGDYDYVINGNMIAGFALIARPVEYDFTGVQTFVVNQYGTVYQKDLGPDTAALADEDQSVRPGRFMVGCD